MTAETTFYRTGPFLFIRFCGLGSFGLVPSLAGLGLLLFVPIPVVPERPESFPETFPEIPELVFVPLELP